MMVTRRPDGNLVARPMTTERRLKGVDLCFVGNADNNTFEELSYDPHVCLTYYKDSTGEYVSVSGTARLSRDRDLIEEVWSKDLEAWFPNINSVEPTSDPRIMLIVVNTTSVTYSSVDKTSPKVLYDLATSSMTGSAVPTTQMKTRELDSEDVRAARRMEE
ncbi:hypothetical protein BKA69DRAFT_1100951 [Paraphysoderma sedebokerense]|nr:hypothetical protein BKA69DRAFT_1100951 [Paraphysoderma sedebokerense]